MGAPTPRSPNGVTQTTSTNNLATGTSASITKPTGTVQGDILRFNLRVTGGTNATITPPGDWNLILRTNQGTSIALASYWKLAGASEPSTYTVSYNDGGSATWLMYGVTAWTNCDPVAPVAASAAASSASGTPTAPTIDTGADNRVVQCIYAARNSTTSSTIPSWSPPAGFTERYDSGAIPGGGVNAGYGLMGCDAEYLTRNSNIGTKAATYTSAGGTINYAAHTIVLNGVLSASSTDALGITDSTVPLKGYLTTNPEGITDSLAKARGIAKADGMGITDSVTYIHTRPAEWITGYYSI